MFANNSMGVLNVAFPDVCKVPTPAGLVPAPLVNVASSLAHVPVQVRVLFGPGFAENLLTTGTISNGDEAGVGLGVVSHTIMGPDRPVTASFRVFVGGIPATRLTTVTAQNGLPPNAAGASLTPAQFRVLTLG
jgi:hypothetical protein